MIRVPPRPPPEDFDARVRQPGLKWLASHPTGTPKNYWLRCKAALSEAFDHRCAYLAIRVHDGEVDHFISCKEDRSRAYDWANYRYCEPRINKRKGGLPAATLLDPFEVEDGWFELDDPNLFVRVTDRCPPELRQRAQDTLRRLGLEDDDKVIDSRRYLVTAFESGHVSMVHIEREDPLLARMLRRRTAAIG